MSPHFIWTVHYGRKKIRKLLCDCLPWERFWFARVIIHRKWWSWHWFHFLSGAEDVCLYSGGFSLSQCECWLWRKPLFILYLAVALLVIFWRLGYLRTEGKKYPYFWAFYWDPFNQNHTVLNLNEYLECICLSKWRCYMDLVAVVLFFVSVSSTQNWQERHFLNYKIISESFMISSLLYNLNWRFLI